MDPLSTVFSALADPTRRAILARLSQGEATVGELARPFDISAPAISRHIKVLRQAGLIETIPEAQRRRCRLRAGRLQQASEWIEQQRRFWTQSLDRLDAVLSQGEGRDNG